eukprot:4935947-Pyramimonas_sp.AAC.1
MSRAAVVQNSDRTQAKYREGWRKDTSEGAPARYYAAVAGKTAALSADTSAFAWIPASPIKRLAHGNVAREVKARALAHRWMSRQVYHNRPPAGKHAVCPTWKWWAYLSGRVDKTDYGSDMGIFNIFDWDTTDPDAIDRVETTSGWHRWCHPNRANFPEGLNRLRQSIH